MSASERILVVDDEPGVRSSLEGILEDERFIVRSVGSGEAAIEAANESAFDLVLLDVWLPGIDGLETLQRLRDDRVDAEVVMISGHGTIETAVRATKLGAFDFVEKPLSLDKTLVVVRNALRARRLERRNFALLEQLARDTEILGPSAPATRLRRAIEAAATSDSPVMLRGERGTGRSIVARRIHSSSRRADEPFVEVPCGALDAGAARSVLFGDGEQPGRIEITGGGSLFLENVHRLASEVRSELAATIAGEPFRSGGARVISSVEASAELPEDDLTARLRGLRVELPTLRDRREDVTVLAEYYMSMLAREYGREAKRWTPRALLALEAYDWPGNVRELRHLVEQVLLSSDDDSIDVDALPEPLGTSSAPTVDLYGEFEGLDAALRAFERYHVTRAIERESGRVDAAADRLGLRTSDLRQRMRRLGI